MKYISAKNSFKFFFTLSFFLATSCSFIVDLDADKGVESLELKGQKLVLAFSHNVNGETHPCGCRHFPLGGLPQLAGQLHDLKKDAQVLYVDSGDLFFPNSVMIPSIEKSLNFTADQLLKATKQLGLQYFLPGDQDFAEGLPFLNKVAGQVDLLIGNLKDQTTLKHKNWTSFQKGAFRLYMTGLVEPQNLPYAYQEFFLPPQEALAAIIKEMTQKGYDAKNPMHRLVVLSHGGMDNDHQLAKVYPQIDWIIGAHDQKFTQRVEKEGNTQIVQVLSRNHYLGAITFNLGQDKKSDSFIIHEIREERAELLKPNPWFEFLDQHKSQLAKVQKEEQEQLVHSNPEDKKTLPYSDAVSCISCHQPQGDWWQKTPHAMALASLIKSKAQDNPACIKCHSLGHEDERGFQSTQDIVKFKAIDDKVMNEKRLNLAREKYWTQAFRFIPTKNSIRQMSDKERLKHSQVWVNFDKKFNHKGVVVANNYSNVQCLNCHSKDPEHPFESNKVVLSKAQKKEAISDKCLNCHTPDQSPGWYKEGGPSLDFEVFNQMYSKMSCPAFESGP